MINIFEEIIESLGAVYEKSKDPEIKFVRDALLRHMILFNLLLADLLQTSNNFFKLSRSSFHRYRVKLTGSRNASENTWEISKQRDYFFSTMQTIIYMLLTSNQSYLV